MPVLSPVTLVLILLAVAWAQFAFASESANPFVRPRPPLLRRRWRYGRRMGVSVLSGGGCGLLVNASSATTPISAIVVGAVVYAAIAVPSIVAFRTRGGPWGGGPAPTARPVPAEVPPAGDETGVDDASPEDVARSRERPVDIVI